MIGSRISHYRIQREIGRGGMGVVYQAHDELLQRDVALKFLPVEQLASDSRRRRFLSEARAASALNHPNILTIHDIVELDDQFFIVMEYLDGENLAEHFDAGPRSVSEAVEIIYQIAEGLAAAHREGIIHRDVKPGNVMITRDGRVKLTDFGLAKLVEESSVTHTGQVVGTASYMSPEQIRGESLDHRTDIWSLGVTFYELLCGRHPFQGRYIEAIVYSVLNTEPVDPRSLNDDVDQSICDILDRCLCKDPEARYASVAEFLEDLDRAIHTAGISLSSDFRTRHLHERRFTRVLVGVAALAVLLIGLPAMPVVRETVQQVWSARTGEPVSIAVLPVRQIGGESVSSLLAEGLHYDLTSELLKLKTSRNRLSVIPASEVRAENVMSVLEADSVFGVNHVIAPTLARVNGRLRLTVGLIDARTRSMLEQISIEAPETNLISFQNESQGVFTSLLGPALSDLGDSGRSGGTQTPVAYQLYLEGEAYLNRRSTEESVDSAIAAFRKAVEADERYALAYAGLGEAYWRKYELTNELQYVDRAIENAHVAVGIDETLAPVHSTLGLVHLNRGRTAEAIEAYERALRIEPNRMDALVGLGLSWQRLGEADSAEAWYGRVIEEYPRSVVGYNRLGILHYLTGNYEQAAAQFSRVIELDPDNPWGYNNLSQTNDHLGRQTDSIRLLQKAVDLEPNPLFFRNLTALYFFEGDYRSAVDVAERALEHGRREYRTWSQLANALYWADGGSDRAREAWIRTVELAEDALRVDPTDGAAMDYLVAALANLERPEETFQAIERLRSTATLGAMNYNTLAHAYERLGHRDSALVYTRLALENGIQPKYVIDSPWLAAMRRDQRFDEMVDRPELVRRVD